MTVCRRPEHYPVEYRERVTRMAIAAEQYSCLQWAVITSLAEKLDPTAETMPMCEPPRVLRRF
jgi:hypothetical protein